MASSQAEALRLHVDERVGDVSGLWWHPTGADAALVLAHGAGADMRHAFMEAMAARLAARRIATLRFQFPYAEQGRRSPGPRPVLQATIRAALADAAGRAQALPLFAGGKSMGGRMTSLLAAAEGLPVRGIVFLGFPLHPAGRPSDERAAHLSGVALPMLFLQGSRDRLAELALMAPAVEALGARARLHVVDGGDHGFHVRKRSGRSADEALDEVADATRAFLSTVLAE